MKKNTSDFFDKTGFADYRIVSENGFRAEQLEKIKDIKGVDAAARYVCTNVGIVGRPDDSVALAVTEDERVSGMYLVSGDKYDKNSTDGIWLSDKYAAANDISVGDELTFSYKGINISGKVKGLIKSGEQMICIRDETQVMPDYTLHGFAYISPVLYKNSLGIDFYPQINILSSLDKSELIERADKALGKTELILTKDETASYSGASSESEEGKTMGSVLPVLFLIIAVLTMVTTMHRIAAKEKTQIGTLKALGFKDRRTNAFPSAWIALSLDERVRLPPEIVIFPVGVAPLSIVTSFLVCNASSYALITIVPPVTVIPLSAFIPLVE